jgi:hypothetical protein
MTRFAALQKAFATYKSGRGDVDRPIATVWYEKKGAA